MVEPPAVAQGRSHPMLTSSFASPTAAVMALLDARTKAWMIARLMQGAEAPLGRVV